MLSRKDAFFISDGEPKTFDHDETLPPLPLPKLENTLERYFDSLRPFATEEELANSRKVINKFRNGLGKELQQYLEKRAKTERNWVEKWWEDYGYFMLRVPLYPYTIMATALPLRTVGVPETKEYCLKAAARVTYHTIEYWDILCRERIRPLVSPDGTKHSMVLCRRMFNTTRVPGDPIDRVETHFKLCSEGGRPSHGIIMGKGRIFLFNVLDENENLRSPQEILCILQIVRGALDSGSIGDCVPALTNDDRTTWAKNRKHLQELSVHNKNLLKLVESSCIMLYFDDHEPANYSENSAFTIAGDMYTKWADRSSVMMIYPNGHLAMVGEHSAYDGSLSAAFTFYILLSLLECGEPDWNLTPKSITVPVENFFDLDDHLRNEIRRTCDDCKNRESDVIVSDQFFSGFGKDFLKQCKLHPDAFVQMALQLAYYKMHEETVPTYETALMRQYYNGRTETLRSCTMDTVKFVKIAVDPKSTKKEIYEALKVAIKTHSEMMTAARNGNGVDRHLFGLYCAAYEQGLEIPEFYSDPLYSKSGGGGNYVLSTSTLGYTLLTGFVAPMVQDGYGVFYSFTSNEIHLITTAYRASPTTGAFKYSSFIQQTLMQMKAIVEEAATAKL